MDEVLSTLTTAERSELVRLCELHRITMAQAVAEGVRAMIAADPEVWQNAKR